MNNKHTLFYYLQRMFQEGSYEYNKNEFTLSLEYANITRTPYLHSLTRTPYYVLRKLNSPYHLSIFENEFNNKKFHIKNDYYNVYMTYQLIGNNIVPIIKNEQDYYVYNNYFHNSKDVKDLLKLYNDLIMSLQHFIHNTQVGGKNYYALYRKYKSKYFSSLRDI